MKPSCVRCSSHSIGSVRWSGRRDHIDRAVPPLLLCEVATLRCVARVCCPDSLADRDAHAAEHRTPNVQRRISAFMRNRFRHRTHIPACAAMSSARHRPVCRATPHGQLQTLAVCLLSTGMHTRLALAMLDSFAYRSGFGRRLSSAEDRCGAIRPCLSLAHGPGTQFTPADSRETT